MHFLPLMILLVFFLLLFLPSFLLLQNLSTSICTLDISFPFCVTPLLFVVLEVQIWLKAASLPAGCWSCVLNCVWECCWWGPGILLMLVIFILRTISRCICILVAPDLPAICSFIHMQYICKGIICLFWLQAAGKIRTHLMNCVLPVFNVWMICRKPFLFFWYSWFEFQMNLRKWKEQVKKVWVLKTRSFHVFVLILWGSLRNETVQNKSPSNRSSTSCDVRSPSSGTYVVMHFMLPTYG